MSYLPDHRVSAVHQYADGLLRQLSETGAHQGDVVSCGKQCSACCYEPAYADRREVLHMLSGLTAEQLEAVRARTAAWVEAVKDSPLLQESLPRALAWRGMKAACPFLENHRCMVYERRPLGCRTHQAVGHPALCHHDELRPQQRFLESPEAKDAIAWYMAKCWERIEMDHIGVLLALLLLGIPLRSGARKSISRGQIQLARGLERRLQVSKKKGPTARRASGPESSQRNPPEQAPK